MNKLDFNNPHWRQFIDEGIFTKKEKEVFILRNALRDIIDTINELIDEVESLKNHTQQRNE